jgi:nucleoside-diphosphate-sugar epimerase
MPAALARGLARGGEALSRLIRRPPLLGTGQLHFLLWQARADSSRAREELGVSFRPWREGIERTVAWLLDTGRV